VSPPADGSLVTSLLVGALFRYALTVPRAYTWQQSPLRDTLRNGGAFNASPPRRALVGRAEANELLTDLAQLSQATHFSSANWPSTP